MYRYDWTLTGAEYVPPAPPGCSFTATPQSGPAPLTVQFNDTSTNDPTSWSWDFGDGGTSTQQNPQHTYLSAGNYSVNHSATNPSGTGWLNRANYITVSDPAASIPIVKFVTNVSSGYAPLAVKFTDQSTGRSLNRWNWNFGDGNWFNTTSSSQSSPVHIYPNPGIYAPQLTVCNASGCNTTSPGLRLVNASILIPPIVNFTNTNSTGLTPNLVKFTDQSTISPASWNWNFGDGSPWFNTTNSSQRSPAHTYPSAGIYTAKLIACNAAGCNTTGPTRSISASMAGFTTNVTSGPAPLAVKFFDTTTGVTLSRWNWSFGDNIWYNTTTKSLRNATHSYTSPGSYTARLMVCTGSGSSLRCNTTPVGQVITVTGGQTTFYVYAEGVGLYHGTQPGLSLGNITPGDFYNYILDHRCGTVNTEKCWEGRGLYVDDEAGSVHWSTAEQASSYADNADFALFVGHGWNDRIYFGTQNSVLELERPYLSFGGNRAKWITLDACYVLNQSTQTNWESVFNGVHIVNGFDTMGLLFDYQGTKYAQMLTGTGGGYDRTKIRDAWKLMLKETIQKESIKGAYMWADPCGEDYLPGFGDYCTAPTKNGEGKYSIHWDNFPCSFP